MVQMWWPVAFRVEPIVRVRVVAGEGEGVRGKMGVVDVRGSCGGFILMVCFFILRGRGTCVGAWIRGISPSCGCGFRVLWCFWVGDDG